MLEMETEVKGPHYHPSVDVIDHGLDAFEDELVSTNYLTKWPCISFRDIDSQSGG